MDSITDIDGEVFKNPSAKTWAVVSLSLKIAEDEAMLERILNYCMRDGNQLSSFNDLLSEPSRFKKMLLRYPDVAKEYYERLTEERAEKVKEAKKNITKQRKMRRKFK